MRGESTLLAKLSFGGHVGVTSARSIFAVSFVAVALHLPAAWAFLTHGVPARFSPSQQASTLRVSELISRPSPLRMLAATTISSSSSFTTPTTSDITEIVSTGQGKTGPYDWSFLDRVYLITCPNADPGSVRLNKAKAILSGLGLLDKVEVREFDTDDEDRIRGCYASHISVIRNAMDEIRCRSDSGGEQKQEWWQQLLPFVEANGRPNGAASSAAGHKSSPSGGGVGAKILILEDNLDFSGSLRQSSLDALNTFASRGDTEWNMIHLSYIPYVPNLLVTKTDDKDVVKLSCGIGSALGTTAYIINDSGMEALLKEDEARGYYAAIPDVMAKLFPETRYASNPVPFLRAPKTPSLVNPQLDDLRSVLFQPGVVSAVQSVFATTGLSSNNLFISTVVSLLVVAGLAGRVTVDAGMQLASTGAYEGNILLPVVGSAFSLSSLGVLAFGAAIAPKPPSETDAVAE